jgi:hypothetical protein
MKINLQIVINRAFKIQIVKMKDPCYFHHSRCKTLEQQWPSTSSIRRNGRRRFEKDGKTGTGSLRRVVTRMWTRADEILLCDVFESGEDSSKDEVVFALLP